MSVRPGTGFEAPPRSELNDRAGRSRAPAPKKAPGLPSHLETLTYRSGDRIYGQNNHVLGPVRSSRNIYAAGNFIGYNEAESTGVDP